MGCASGVREARAPGAECARGRTPRCGEVREAVWPVRMAGRPASRAQSGAPPAGGWGRVYGGDVVRGAGEEPPGHGGRK